MSKQGDPIASYLGSTPAKSVVWHVGAFTTASATRQDLSAGTPAISGEWIKAGTGPCGPECNNYGRISYTRTLNYEYLAVCGHWLRVWTWDQVKSPQPGYGWSSRDVQVAC